MKRIVVLIDGTWNKEGTAGNTNVATLDIAHRIAANAFIKAEATDGIAQHVHYHDGVGTESDFFKRFLGGAIGFGLKQIIKECYGFVVADFAAGDESYIVGFSRGAYAARALAGLIGASGIQREAGADTFEVAWQHYRVKPAVRRQPETGSSADRKTIADYEALATRQAFHDTRAVKCVAVWDTVGSYGIPAGFGLAPLARYFTLAALGFHDTSFGDNVEVGLASLDTDLLAYVLGLFRLACHVETVAAGDRDHPTARNNQIGAALVAISIARLIFLILLIRYAEGN
jgi:uncharacterized protein (DUF2235 family)